MIGKKQLILSTAQALFYEEGLNNTSFERIAEQCNITKPLITYHFGTKAHLAGTIFGKYSKEMSNVFSQKVYKNVFGYDAVEINVAFSLLQLRYYMQDKNAFRFYKEFFDSSFVDVTEGVEDFYKMLNRHMGLKIDKDKLHMLYIGSNYAARGLIYHFIIGDIKCSLEEFEAYFVPSGLFGYGLGNEKIQTLLEKGRELVGNIKMEFLPNFVWR